MRPSSGTEALLPTTFTVSEYLLGELNADTLSNSKYSTAKRRETYEETV